MTDDKPIMDDGFLISDFSGDGIDPPFMLERYVGGVVRDAWSYATKNELLQAVVDLGDFYYGGGRQHDSH